MTPGLASFYFGCLSSAAAGLHANRLARRTDWQAGGFGRESFNDPALNVGAGLRIDLGSRLFLRPDARALVVTADGDTHTVGVFTINFGYGF